MLTSQVLAQSDHSGGMDNAWLMYVLFAVAGLLVGGCWSTYHNGSKKLTIILAILAAMAGVAAVMWLIGGMT